MRVGREPFVETNGTEPCILTTAFCRGWSFLIGDLKPI